MSSSVLCRWSARVAGALIVVFVAAAPAQAQRRRNYAPAPPAAAAPAARVAAAPSARPMPLTYPASTKSDQIDDYHGTKVPDPYRWLEDLDSPQTKAWGEAQNKVAFGWLGQVQGGEAIRKRLTELWNYERYGLPHKKS